MKIKCLPFDWNVRNVLEQFEGWRDKEEFESNVRFYEKNHDEFVRLFIDIEEIENAETS